jgi:transposase-like protein
MHPNEQRRRRRHTESFKAEAIAACREPGASVAAVALERQVNANLLRKWVKDAGAVPAAVRVVAATEPLSASPTFVPVKLEPRSEPTRDERPIRVHIRKGRSRITIEWPATAAASCAGWLRELLG